MKVYTRNNYFFIEEGDKIYEGLTKDVIVKRLDFDSTEFAFGGVNNFNPSSLHDITTIDDEHGNNYSLEGFIKFFTINTGKGALRGYKEEVAVGNVDGETLWNKFGYNNDLDVGTEVVASFGGTFTPLLVATTLDIVSSDAADVNGGTGCNTIVIYGVDANRDEQVELVQMNGTTNVITTSTWLGINRVVMFLCGSDKTNQGEIDIVSVNDASFMAQMPALEGVTQQCIFHIPRGSSLILEWLRINVLNRNKDAELTIKMIVYSPVSNGQQEVYKVDIDTSQTNDINENPNLPFPVTEQSVIWLEATSDKADIIVNARFSGILEEV